MSMPTAVLLIAIFVFLLIFLALSWRQGRLQPRVRDVVEPSTDPDGVARDAAGDVLGRRREPEPIERA